ARVRAVWPARVCAGLGIRSREQVVRRAPQVDGIIGGSALVEGIERVEDPAQFLRSLRGDQRSTRLVIHSERAELDTAPNHPAAFPGMERMAIPRPRILQDRHALCRMVAARTKPPARSFNSPTARRRTWNSSPGSSTSSCTSTDI